ncbi:MAG: hypothetical protein WCN85_12590 [Burkholderiales bacterium]
MLNQVEQLRAQLSRFLELHNDDAPEVEHLRWHIASLERLARWQQEAVSLMNSQRDVETA